MNDNESVGSLSMENSFRGRVGPGSHTAWDSRGQMLSGGGTGLVVGGAEYGVAGIRKAVVQGKVRVGNGKGSPEAVSVEEAAASCSPRVSPLGRGLARGVSRELSHSHQSRNAGIWLKG